MESCGGKSERTWPPDQSQWRVARCFERVILPLQFVRTSRAATRGIPLMAGRASYIISAYATLDISYVRRVSQDRAINHDAGRELGCSCMLARQRDQPTAWVVESSTPCLERTHIKPSPDIQRCHSWPGLKRGRKVKPIVRLLRYWCFLQEAGIRVGVGD